MAAKPPKVTVSCSSNTTKGLCDRPLETFARSPLKLCGTHRWQVAAALSAAVTATELIGDTPNLQAEPTMKRGSTQTPAAFRKGARGRGPSQKGRLPRKFRMSPISSYSSEEGVWGRGASLREAASPPESPLPSALTWIYQIKRLCRAGDFVYNKLVETLSIEGAPQERRGRDVDSYDAAAAQNKDRLHDGSQPV